MINWQIRKEKIENLKFNEKNPRTFTEKGLKDLKKSIQKYSDANIITINADNTVLGGHARLTVMKQMGITEVDVKYPNKQLTEKQCDEILIRLNANIAGEWDIEKLQEEFNVSDLNEWGFEIEFPKEEEQNIINEKQSISELIEHLPEELKDTKLQPEQFTEIVSSFKPERERIIITYPQNREEELKNLLGLSQIIKVVYSLEEIVGNNFES